MNDKAERSACFPSVPEELRSQGARGMFGAGLGFKGLCGRRVCVWVLFGRFLHGCFFPPSHPLMQPRAHIHSLLSLSTVRLVFSNHLVFQRMSQSVFTQVIIAMVCVFVCVQNCLERESIL